jgi:hypothetical protein
VTGNRLACSDIVIDIGIGIGIGIGVAIANPALSGLRPSAQDVALLHQNAKAKGGAFAQSRKSEEEEEEEAG